MTDALTADLMLRAYGSGIFPMAEGRSDPRVHWVDPTRRGIMPLNNFHISRSLAKAMRSPKISATFDKDFGAVLAACADRDETWINEPIHDAYMTLHDQGFAHSLEIREDGNLVGGIFGVALGSAFFGESMYSHRRDASKMALAWLVDRLRQTGFQLFDTQFITPHLKTLGGIEINRSDYLERLALALETDADIAATVSLASAQDVIQRNTQTS